MAIIVCPQPQAAEIGLEVMRRGGNAVDAAVTCAFVQGVLDPQMCGIGGGGMMLVHRAATRTTETIEFHPRAGGQVRPDLWEPIFLKEAADRYNYVVEGGVNDAGYQSVAVPGTVAGLALALERRVHSVIGHEQVREEGASAHLVRCPRLPRARRVVPVEADADFPSATMKIADWEGPLLTTPMTLAT